MPRLISEVNSGGGAIGISSDGVELGSMKKLDYESNRIEYDTNTGIARPLTIIGL